MRRWIRFMRLTVLRGGKFSASSAAGTLVARRSIACNGGVLVRIAFRGSHVIFLLPTFPAWWRPMTPTLRYFRLDRLHPSALRLVTLSADRRWLLRLPFLGGPPACNASLLTACPGSLCVFVCTLCLHVLVYRLFVSVS